jgi:7,8-dihydropterin-6-yl-methyl-4-(beta-D-ribofuranosyl)aminobenzene 5'-phosphate synthase
MQSMRIGPIIKRSLAGAALLMAFVPRQIPAQSTKESGPQAPSRIKSVKVVVLSTMLTDSKGIGEWGFSALVEADGHLVLFDTGARPETVLNNARELKIDLSGVTDAILSHHHGDHTGGLLSLRRELMKSNPSALSRSYVGKGIFLSRSDEAGVEANETVALRAPYEATGGRFVEIDRPTSMFAGAWLTGPVPRRHPERNWTPREKVKTEAGLVEDTIPEDMSLVLDTTNGLVVVSGCGHAGIVNTLEYAREHVRMAPVVAALGGFHLFDADERTLEWTAERLRALKLEQLLGAHCTGVEAVYELRRRLDLKRATCVVGAVGAGFDLSEGIKPGHIAH